MLNPDVTLYCTKYRPLHRLFPQTYMSYIHETDGADVMQPTYSELYDRKASYFLTESYQRFVSRVFLFMYV